MARVLISDLMDDPYAPRWVEYPHIPGARVRLRLPDVPENTRLLVLATVPDGEDERGKPRYKIDLPDFHNQIIRFSLADWGGFRVEHLPQLIPGRKLRIEGAQAGTELTFCPENRDFLLGHSADFYNWLSAEVRRWEREIREQEEKEKENLSPTPDTSPTLTE